MNFTKTVAVGAFLATTLVAGSAFAKAHDQSADNKNGNPLMFDLSPPGQNAYAETAAAARTLGESRGNRPERAGPPAHAGRTTDQMASDEDR